MAPIDLTHYRQIIDRFLDREPVNDDTSGANIWCLGCSYSPASCQPESESRHITTGLNQSIDLTHALDSIPSTEHSKPPSEFMTADQSSSTSQDVVSQLDCSTTQPLSDSLNSWPSAFLEDFESRIWLTYRSNFAPIPRSSRLLTDSKLSLSVRLRTHFSEDTGFTSDTGWGCMIRSGQSLLANTILVLEKGRSWRRNATNDESAILKLFVDEPTAPFSIHRFVAYGASNCGKSPGEWFGPSATGRCIKALSDAALGGKLRVWVSQESGEVAVPELLKEAQDDAGQFRPTLVLLSTRLGIDRITPVYWEGLKVALQVPQAIGIAGGRPAASHYFVGLQGTSMLYLDPHHTRPALLVDPLTKELPGPAVATCHTRRLRRLAFEAIDPSMLIGFILRDQHDFENWRRDMINVPGQTLVHFTTSNHSSDLSGERSSAIDEVQSISEGEDEAPGA